MTNIELEDLINHPIQLKNVDLIFCNLNKDTKFKEDNLKEKVSLNLKTWGEVDKEDLNIGYSYLNIKITYPNKFDIEMTYRGTCSLDFNIESDQKYENFLETQGLKLLWPYLRVSITDMMIKMDLNPIKLPTIDVLATMKKANK